MILLAILAVGLCVLGLLALALHLVEHHTLRYEGRHRGPGRQTRTAARALRETT